MSKAITPQQFMDLVKDTNQENPRPEDIRALRRALAGNPELFEITGNLAQQCQYTLLQNVPMSGAAREIVAAGIERLRKDLGYLEASALEKLLIEQIILCYLRLYLWEFGYHALAGNREMTLKQGKDWEDLISSGQRRYLRSIETLARVRKQSIHIQLNVATNGGQQVNIENLP